MKPLYIKEALHSPSLLIISIALTLKEYSTLIANSTMYCDVVFMLTSLSEEASPFEMVHHHLTASVVM